MLRSEQPRARWCIFDRVRGETSYRPAAARKGLAGAHAVAMRTLLGGAKEAMRQPTGMAKACLTVIEVKGKAVRGEFSSVLVVGTLLSPP